MSPGALGRRNFMYFKTADVAGLRIFYREAGDPSKEPILHIRQIK